jgi:hypothetical protein
MYLRTNPSTVNPAPMSITVAPPSGTLTLAGTGGNGCGVATAVKAAATHITEIKVNVFIKL